MRQIMTTKTTYKKWLQKRADQKSYHINYNKRGVIKKKL